MAAIGNKLSKTGQQKHRAQKQDRRIVRFTELVPLIGANFLTATAIHAKYTRTCQQIPNQRKHPVSDLHKSQTNGTDNGIRYHNPQTHKPSNLRLTEQGYKEHQNRGPTQ